MQSSVCLRYAAPVLILLVLPLVTYSKVIPWTLDYPIVTLIDGKISVNMTGSTDVKKLTFIMAVNKKVTYSKAPTKFKLGCNADLVCSGSGGPKVGYTDKVYYGMIAVINNEKKDKMKFKNKKFERLRKFKASSGVSFKISPPTMNKF